jgi:hypothetical protein
MTHVVEGEALKLRSIASRCVLVVALLVSSDIAWAQDAASSLQQSSSISTQEKLDFTDAALSEMKDNIKAIRKLMDSAERDGDLDQIQCVRNKLASIQALLSVSERAQGAMKDALSNGQVDRAEYEFRKLAVAISKVRQFMAEAQACVGTEDLANGSSQNIDVSTGALPADDDATSEVPSNDVFIGVDPPNASPFE